jgi:hypothetical protein
MLIRFICGLGEWGTDMIALLLKSLAAAVGIPLSLFLFG